MNSNATFYMGINSLEVDQMDVKEISEKFVSMWKNQMIEVENHLRATKLSNKHEQESLKERNAVKVKKGGDFDLTLGAIRMHIDRCIEKEDAAEQYKVCLLLAAKISKDVERTFRPMNSVKFYKTAAGTPKDSLKGTLKSTLTHLTKTNAFKMVHLLPDEDESKTTFHKSLEEIHGRPRIDSFDLHDTLSTTEELHEAMSREERKAEIVEGSFELTFTDPQIKDFIRSTEKNNVEEKLRRKFLFDPIEFKEEISDWSSGFETDGSSTTVSSASGDEIIQRLKAHRKKKFERVKELWKLRRKIEFDGLGSEKSEDEVLTDFETYEKPPPRPFDELDNLIKSIKHEID